MKRDQFFQTGIIDAQPKINGYAVRPDPALIDRPRYVHSEHLEQAPAPGKPPGAKAFAAFVKADSHQITAELGLKKRI